MCDSPEVIRKKNMSYLQARGFHPADWLPLVVRAGESAEPGELSGVLRSTREIAHRYMALFGVFAWGSAPPEMADSIAQFIDRNQLSLAMTPSELAICDLTKADANTQHQGTVGWRLENMWPLAWVLGLAPEPCVETGQLPEEITGEMLSQFLPEFSTTVDGLLESGDLQSEEEVVRLFDLFFCAHNAVRSGQLGRPTIPEEYDPIGDGGTIHERRHSLEWMLTPGVAWDDIELHT